MGVRLRYLAHDLEVPFGQFVIGRSPDCQLSLDDGLVSRRHALLVVRADGVTIEDLGSRNGVQVNGTNIDGMRPLSDGDRITIGTQQLTLLRTVDQVPSRRRADRQTLMRPAEEDTVSRRAREGTPASNPPSGPPTDPSARSARLTDPRRDDDEATTTVGQNPLLSNGQAHPDKRVHGLALIGSVAEKALALGRVEEAERLLQRPLLELLAKSSDGEPIAPPVAEAAGFYAARLASATGKGSWIDFVFGLFARSGNLLPASLVDELYSAVRKVKTLDKDVLKGYVAVLRDRAPSFGPAERFVFQRIEGLERLGALK